MKREILDVKLRRHINDCCPGHDDWPHNSYKSRVSEHALSKSKSKERRYARRVKKQLIVEDDQ